MAFLREETKKRGFPTVDGVHMGPCEIHREHAHTIGPDGVAVRLPGLRRRRAAVHRPHRRPHRRRGARRRRRSFEQLAAWKECNDCAFIPVCAGGCTVAAHTELGDMNTPNCHKPTFEAGLIALARDAAAARGAELVN